MLGALVIHGFTGTPNSVGYLAERMRAAHYVVETPLLPGHGTSVHDLERATWRDWTGAVDRAFDALRERCRRVVVVGQSLGGLLALHLAANRPEVAAVAALATPLWLEGLAGRVARWSADERIPRWLRFVPKGGADVRDRAVRRAMTGYRAVPLRALGELHRFMHVVDDELRRVTQPLLVMHATHDHVAPPACAAALASRVGSRDPHIVRLERSYHLIAVDVERDVVAAEVLDHFRRHVHVQGDLACAT